jgi:hypothetical protein
MKTVSILGVFSLIGLTGCAVLPQDEQYGFSNASAKFSFVKQGCVIEEGKYTDVSGKGKSRPYIKLIAVTNGGETVAEWSGYCNTVIPNGSSQCRLSGPRKASFQCANYDSYRATF